MTSNFCDSEENACISTVLASQKTIPLSIANLSVSELPVKLDESWNQAVTESVESLSWLYLPLKDVLAIKETLANLELLLQSGPPCLCTSVWGRISGWSWWYLASIGLYVERRPRQLISWNPIFYRLEMGKGKLWNRNFCHNATSLVTKNYLQYKHSHVNWNLSLIPVQSTGDGPR